MLVTVSYWLDKHRQKTLYRLFNQQCLTTLDHEAFKRSIKKDTDADQGESEPPPEINTLSTIDFKISYGDFKLGIIKSHQLGNNSFGLIQAYYLKSN